MADEKPENAGGDGSGAAGDLSVPMWVWTLLGFALVTAVVIIVIIWGGIKPPPPGEDPLMMEEAAQTEPADTETQPATAPTAP